MSPHEQDLEQKLARVSAVLARTRPGPEATPREERERLRELGGWVLTLAAPVALIGATTGETWLALSAAVVGVGGAVEALVRRRKGRGMPARARIGMGASVASDARLEPGAVLEMGVTVESGAVVKRGAVVRWGATVGANAVIEEDASIGWGVSIGQRAHVGPRAAIWAGADVEAGASVPADTSILPGSTWSAASKASQQGKEALASDPREERIAKVCRRLEAELALAPQAARTYLGSTASTAKALWQTCHLLLRREAELRLESSPEAIAELTREKAALEQRSSATEDAQTRKSLEEAASAVAGQVRQREAFRKSADRIDAELTRLLWTIEGMSTQLVRLRSAGAEVREGPGEELTQSVKRLNEEIEAIAESLEHVSQGGIAPVASIEQSPPGGRGPSLRER